MLKNDYKTVGEIQKLFSGGSVYEVKINKTFGVNKLEDFVVTLFNNDVGMIKFKNKEVV